MKKAIKKFARLIFRGLTRRNTIIAFFICALLFYSFFSAYAQAVMLSPETGQAIAGGVQEVGEGLMAQVAGGLESVVIRFLSIFVDLFRTLIDWVLNAIDWLVNPAMNTFAFVRNPIVVIGWTFMRDLVNLGLVMGIAIIAIGFILRMESYGSKRTLGNLIIVALLVNFSLPIAGIFIDAAGILTRAVSTQINITNDFHAATAFNENVRMDQNSPPLAEGIVGGQQATILHHMLRIFFSIIFLAALLSVMLMLIYRLAYLWFLLILAPLAWFSWIFPSTTSFWKQWWQKFLQWTFFAPLVLLFLSLAVRMSAVVPQQPAGGIIAGWAQMMVQFLIAITAIILALKLAHQLGIAGAQTGINFATNAAKLPYTLGRKGAVSGYGVTKNRFATSEFAKNLQKRFTDTKSPILGRIADRLTGARESAQGEMTKNVDQAEKRYNAFSSEELKKISENLSLNSTQLLALSRVLNKRGEQLPEGVGQRAVEAAYRTGGAKEAEQFLPANLHLIDHYEKNIIKRANPRNAADYAKRMTTEQAENFKFDKAFETITNPEEHAQAQAVFASGISQSALAHMLEKNHESGQRILEILKDTGSFTTNLEAGLRATGKTKDETEREINKTIPRVQRMLKTPQISGNWMPQTETTQSQTTQASSSPQIITPEHPGWQKTHDEALRGQRR